MDNFEKTVANCTRLLENDPELALDIRRELTSHLEDTAEALRSSGLSAEESEKEALHHFGDAAEIGDRLFDSNLSRMRLRARLRRLAIILLLFAIPVAFYYSLHLDMFAAFGRFQIMEGTAGNNSLWQRLASLSSPKEPGLDKRLIVYGDRSRKATPEMSAEAAAARAIWEKKPDNKIYLANYIIQLLAGREEKNEPKRKYLLAELEKAAQIEPGNAFYTLMQAFVLGQFAARTEAPAKKGGPIQIIVTDQAAFERAMNIYLEALQKPYLRTYQDQLNSIRLAILDYPPDLAGRIQKITISASILLPELNHLRILTSYVTTRGEQLEKQGRAAEAAKYLDSWKPLAKLMNDNNFTLIGILVTNAMLKQHVFAAQDRGDPARCEEITRVRQPVENWRNGIDHASSDLLKRGGFAAQMLLPALRDRIAVEKLAPERHLTYLVIDSINLTLVSFLVFIFLIGHGICLLILRFVNHQRGYFLTLPGKTMCKLILFALLLPLGLYLLWGNTELLSGRSWAPGQNFGLTIIGLLYLLIVIPAIWIVAVKRVLKRRGKELGLQPVPRAVMSFNLFFAWTVLLIGITVITRPLLTVIERYEVSRDTVVFGPCENFTPHEDAVTARLRQELAEKLK